VPATKSVRAAVGEFGERVAAEHLRADGMEVIGARWRCRQGEIDLIAVDDGCLVVCEVKTRRSLAAGSPLEAVTPVKLDRLRRLAAAWLAGQERSFAEVRIDVVAVFLPQRGRAQVEHLRAVV